MADSLSHVVSLIVAAVATLDTATIGGNRIVDWAHYVFCAITWRDGEDKPVFLLLVSLLLRCFGGSILVGLTLGLPPTVLLSNANIPNLLLVCAAIFCVPGIAALCRWRPAKFLINVGDHFCTSFAIIGGINRAASSDIKGSLVALIACGYINGIGGSTLGSMLSLNKRQWQVCRQLLKLSRHPHASFDRFPPSYFFLNSLSLQLLCWFPLHLAPFQYFARPL